jgi:ectoine hydroxylase-related dioxygenase (phytanoyl-CoA dioxygenase family)
MISKIQKDFFLSEGYLVVENIISSKEINYYSNVYNSFLENTIDTSKYRSDLSDDESNIEKITQIMVPSKIHPELLKKPIHKITLQIAKELLGNDIELDFDMMINKAPYTNTSTPWHQDAAYWINMPDKRAVSCWVAIDKAFKENGCMWYTPKSHLFETLPHNQIGDKGALKCDGSEEDSVCIPLTPGSCIFHHGNTLHYSRGNNTKFNRRAIITNCRSKKMIELERSKGYDHTGNRKIK